MQELLLAQPGLSLSATPQDRLMAGDRLFQAHLAPETGENLLNEALDEYARALEQTPDSADITGRMAQVFLKQGNYARAEHYARKTLHLLNQKPGLNASGWWARLRQSVQTRRLAGESHYILAVLHHRIGDRAQARAAYRQSARQSGWQGALARLGLFQASLPSLNGDLPVWRRVALCPQAGYALLSGLLLLPCRSWPIAPVAVAQLAPLMLKAWVQEWMGYPETALRAYLDIHRRFPGVGAVGVIIGTLHQRKGQPDQAQYWFEKMIERHPGLLEAYYYLAKLHEERENYPGMVAVYERLIRLKPGDAHLHCNLANAHYYNQSYPEALNHYDSALQLGTDAHWKAMVAQSIGNLQADYLQNPDAALAYYKMANNLDPAEVENYVQLGLLYYQKGDSANAELIYKRAIVLSPDKPRLYSNLGYLRWMDSDIDGAIGYYEQAIALDGSYEIPINNLGVIHLDMLGEVDKAIALFQRAIEIEPDYALAHYNLGRAYSFLDRRLEAARCFQEAQALNVVSHELDQDELAARINHLFDAPKQELRD